MYLSGSHTRVVGSREYGKEAESLLASEEKLCSMESTISPALAPLQHVSL
jgi:hypothetical protein